VARQLQSSRTMQFKTITDQDLDGVIGGRGLSQPGGEQVRQGLGLAADFFAPSTNAPAGPSSAPAGGGAGGGKISPMRMRELEQQMLAY
jgi:hypothetical protein